MNEREYQRYMYQKWIDERAEEAVSNGKRNAEMVFTGGNNHDERRDRNAF